MSSSLVVVLDAEVEESSHHQSHLIFHCMGGTGGQAHKSGVDLQVGVWCGESAVTATPDPLEESAKK